MLDELTVWIAIAILSPVIFSLGRLVARLILLPFMDDRVEIRYTTADGTVLSKKLKLSSDDDLIELLDRAVKHSRQNKRNA